MATGFSAASSSKGLTVNAHELTTMEINDVIGVVQNEQHASPAYHRREYMTTPAKQFTPNVYAQSDRAPFLVIVQNTNINEISLSKNLIACKLISGVTEIRKVSSNRVRIKCKDWTSANKIIECQELRTKHDVNAFIPNECVKSVGIVKFVPLDLTQEEIMEYLESSIPVEKVERMNYWDRNENCARPGTSLKITFRSTNIPQEVKLYYTIKKVEHFVPRPLICNNCLKFNHIARTCRSRETRCINCSEIKHAAGDASCKGDCVHCLKQCPTKCRNCTDDCNHRTSSASCPVMKVQSRIKEYMVKEKMSYEDAKNKVSSNVSPSITYANVANLQDFNNKLIERLKQTEEILKTIYQLQMHFPTTNKPPEATQNQPECIQLIKTHFDKHKISLGTTIPSTASTKTTSNTTNSTNYPNTNNIPNPSRNSRSDPNMQTDTTNLSKSNNAINLIPS